MMDASKNMNKSALHHFRKTKMCPYFARKSCFFPESCHYAHSVAELRTAPDLFRTSLCKQFAETGYCSNRDMCRFAHGPEELRFTNDYYKTRMCESFEQSGFCENGATCRYAHGHEELRPTPTRLKNESEEIMMNTVSAAALKGLNVREVVVRLRLLVNKIDKIIDQLQFSKDNASTVFDATIIPSLPRILVAFQKLRRIVLSQDIEQILLGNNTNIDPSLALPPSSLSPAIDVHEKLTQLLGFLELLLTNPPISHIRALTRMDKYKKSTNTILNIPIDNKSTEQTPSNTYENEYQENNDENNMRESVSGPSKLMQSSKILGKALSILPVKANAKSYSKSNLAVPIPATPVTGSVFSLRKNIMENTTLSEEDRRHLVPTNVAYINTSEKKDDKTFSINVPGKAVQFYNEELYLNQPTNAMFASAYPQYPYPNPQLTFQNLLYNNPSQFTLNPFFNNLTENKDIKPTNFDYNYKQYGDIPSNAPIQKGDYNAKKIPGISNIELEAQEEDQLLKEAMNDIRND